MNAVLLREEDLREANYILHPSRNNNYWANLSPKPIDELRTRRGEAFNLIFVGSEEDEGDFYAIPYAVVRPALTHEFLSPDQTGRERWIVTIRNHQLKIGLHPLIDVGAFYGNAAILSNPGEFAPGSAADQNDYAIENRKIEIEARQKQSVFRRRVFQNFDGRCCLSGISEDELLIASHIVPWAKRIDTRLDPANGLLLYCPYDRLFDKGFITLDDKLRVLISPMIEDFSPPLRAVLQELVSKEARRPLKWKIKAEYLSYHRTVVFRAGRVAQPPEPEAAAT